MEGEKEVGEIDIKKQKKEDDGYVYLMRMAINAVWSRDKGRREGTVGWIDSKSSF